MCKVKNATLDQLSALYHLTSVTKVFTCFPRKDSGQNKQTSRSYKWARTQAVWVGSRPLPLGCSLYNFVRERGDITESTRSTCSDCVLRNVIAFQYVFAGLTQLSLVVCPITRHRSPRKWLQAVWVEPITREENTHSYKYRLKYLRCYNDVKKAFRIDRI